MAMLRLVEVMKHTKTSLYLSQGSVLPLFSLDWYSKTGLKEPIIDMYYFNVHLTYKRIKFFGACALSKNVNS